MKRTNTFTVRPLSNDGEQVLRDLLDASRQQFFILLVLKSFRMRPNIDISHTLGGRVKDYAEANDLDLSEAYTEVLKAGLEALETQNQQ